MLYRLNDKDFRPNEHNLYFLFGLKSTATAAEIKSAYKKLTRKYHPDYHGGDRKFQDAFAVINSIYAILSNNRKRFDYDYHYRRMIKMLWEHYNPDDYKENKYPLLPEGRYRVRIEDAEEATSQKGNNMIKITLAVSGHRSKLWYYLVLNAKDAEQIKWTNKRLGAIFDSFGIVEGNMHLSDWRGCVGGAQVVHDTDNNGKKNARVAFFLDRDVVFSLPAWQEPTTQAAVNPDMMDFGDSSSGLNNIPF